MNAIREPERMLPIVANVDLCVVGGSCTGVFAAVRAARLGATVAIVENNGFFGGVATKKKHLNGFQKQLSRGMQIPNRGLALCTMRE